MKTLFKGISFSLLLLAGGWAHADPDGGREGEMPLRPAWPQQPQQERQSLYQGAQDDGRYPGPDQTARAPARLSPEQRQALRQQINEAGQDIYRRKRR